MPIIEWNMRYLIGIREIDQHHKHLVELLNKAYDEFRKGNNIEQSVVDELVDHAGYHFTCEERWMAESSYPKLAEHKDEHELFTSRILEFQSKYRKNESVSVEILWFLCNWVTHHILETDAKFGQFIEVQNIRNKVSRKFT